MYIEKDFRGKCSLKKISLFKSNHGCNPISSVLSLFACIYMIYMSIYIFLCEYKVINVIE